MSFTKIVLFFLSCLACSNFAYAQETYAFQDKLNNDSLPYFLTATGVKYSGKTILQIGKTNSSSVYQFTNHQLYHITDIMPSSAQKFVVIGHARDGNIARIISLPQTLNDLDINIKHLFAKNLLLTTHDRDISSFYLNSSNIGSLFILDMIKGTNNGLSEIYKNSKIDTLSYNTSISSQPIFDSTQVNVIKFISCTIKKRISYAGLEIPNEIDLKDIEFSDDKSELDFTNFKNVHGKVCTLFVSKCDFSNIKLDYTNFTLKFSDQYSRGQIESLFKKIIEGQVRNGYESGLKKAEEEFIEFKSNAYNKKSYLSNVLEKWWWNYGLDKEYLLKDSVQIFLLISIINSLFYRKLLVDGYSIPIFLDKYNYLKKYKTSYRARAENFFYCILYTGNLFWGLKIDFDKIKFKNTWIVIWIYFQYLLGLFCITYIIHYYFVEK
jgi:hypothetical protein